MQGDTFVATNSTPQIQNTFNGSIWNNLETAVRDVTTAYSDTVYVVTGPVFSKVGENKSVTYIQPKHDTKKCPVPNYYWKVLLKVKRSGNSITSACAIGFWYEHREYSSAESKKWADYAVSVDQIEAWTGLDLFINLPASIASSAEQNSNWNTFKSF
jgi:endonuclease G